MEELKATMWKEKSYQYNFFKALRKGQVIDNYRKEKVMISCENYIQGE